MSNITRETQKPFWLRPPWTVLFDLIKLHKIRPWDIDLTYLLTTLVDEIKKMGYIHFTASGIALFSSATILRMKSELVLELQEPPKSAEKKLVEFFPPSLQIPYRFKYTSTTIDNLIIALKQSLIDENIIGIRPKLIPINPAPPAVKELDQFMINIEDMVDEIYQKIIQLTAQKETISLTRLTLGLKRLESIRTFILILYLACKDQINLWQKEDSGEIYIRLP